MPTIDGTDGTMYQRGWSARRNAAIARREARDETATRNRVRGTHILLTRLDAELATATGAEREALQKQRDATQADHNDAVRAHEAEQSPKQEPAAPVTPPAPAPAPPAPAPEPPPPPAPVEPPAGEPETTDEGDGFVSTKGI